VRGCTVMREARERSIERCVTASKRDHSGEGGRTTRANGRSGMAGEVAPPGTQHATWQASAAGDQNLKRGVRLVVDFDVGGGAQHRGLRDGSGAPNWTGGASSTRSARACFGSPEEGAGGRGPVRRSARRRPRTTPLN
jgi:hypothetical protein